MIQVCLQMFQINSLSIKNCIMVERKQLPPYECITSYDIATASLQKRVHCFLIKIDISYLFDCKPRHLSSFRAAYFQARLTLFFFFTLSKGLDDAQSFLGYVLSTKLSFRILFSSAPRAHPVAENIMMKGKQLQWCKHHYHMVAKNAKRAGTRKYVRSLGNLCLSAATYNEGWLTVILTTFCAACNRGRLIIE